MAESSSKMKKFEGKKILFLGSNVGTIDMVRYARENGAYTIVADYYPKEKSIAKQYSDKCALISTGDLDGLKKYIVQEGVNGVLAGVSEFNLLNAMRLCNHFNFPFYCTKEQWDEVENKEHFRKLCIRYGVPSPYTYFTGSDFTEEKLTDISFPAIVKPVDASSSIGVAICRNVDSLQKAIIEAKRNSSVGKIIIEEFVEGQEFTAHYTIADGHVSLSCVDNRVPVALRDGDVTTIPVARVYPSTFIDEYIKQVNPQMICLCKSLGMDTGVLFVQGLYDKKRNSFHIFEAGLRCAGEAPYRFIERVNGISFMNNIVDYALLGHAKDFDPLKDDPYMKGKYACVTSFVSKGGRIGNIINYCDIEKEVLSIIGKECRYQIGEETPDGNTLRQIVLRFVLLCDSKEQLVDDTERINKTVKVLDLDGNDLCYTFDVRNYYSDKQ